MEASVIRHTVVSAGQVASDKSRTAVEVETDYQSLRRHHDTKVAAACNI